MIREERREKIDERQKQMRKIQLNDILEIDSIQINEKKRKSKETFRFFDIVNVQ